MCVNPYHYDRVIGPGLDLSGLTLGLAAAVASSSQMPQNWGPYVRRPPTTTTSNWTAAEGGESAAATNATASNGNGVLHYQPQTQKKQEQQVIIRCTVCLEQV